MGFVKKKSGQYYRQQADAKRLGFIKKYGSDILQSPNFKRTGSHIQHGRVSVRRHTMDVARYSLLISEKLKISCNKRDLVRGALLHDYFLYDWHDKNHVNPLRLHGFHHPGIALRNAGKEYALSDREKDIIKKHMWPLTIVPPMCREAWIVTAADKYCSLLETLRLRRPPRG